jgi:hypothetical protein
VHEEAVARSALASDARRVSGRLVPATRSGDEQPRGLPLWRARWR